MTVESGAARGDQLWAFASATEQAAEFMNYNLMLAVARRDFLITQWREANAEVSSLRKHMRDAGIEYPPDKQDVKVYEPVDETEDDGWGG